MSTLLFFFSFQSQPCSVNPHAGKIHRKLILRCLSELLESHTCSPDLLQEHVVQLFTSQVCELQPSLATTRSSSLAVRRDWLLDRKVQLEGLCVSTPCHFRPVLHAFAPKHLGWEPGGFKWCLSEVTQLSEDMKQPTQGSTCPSEAGDAISSPFSREVPIDVILLKPTWFLHLHHVQKHSVVFSGVGFLTGHNRHSDGKHCIGDYKVIVLREQKQPINVHMVDENSLWFLVVLGVYWIHYPYNAENTGF